MRQRVRERSRVRDCAVFAILAATATAMFADTAVSQDRITLQNLTPFGRREWVSVVVPFAKGRVADTPEMHVGEGPTVWQPIGARWPDGSLRQAVCLFPVEMRRMSEVQLKIEDGLGGRLPENAVIDPIRAGAAQISIELLPNGNIEKPTRATPKFVRLLESNAVRKVALHRCRVGATGLVFEVIVTSCMGQPHCYTDLGLFFSDPSSKAMRLDFRSITVETKGMQLMLRHASALAMDVAVGKRGSKVTLLGKTWLGDGQGIRRTGVLLPPLDGQGTLRDQTLQAAALLPVLAATSWRESGAYGPFGVIPDSPPWLRGRASRAAHAARHKSFVAAGRKRGDPFARFPFGLLKDPGASGDQEDFGIVKLSPVATTGLPSFLHEVELSILQEACRPVHFFAEDGAPLQVKDHQDLALWDGRPHWNCGVSKDRLGKPCPAPRFDSHGWRGKDRQHWSSNYLCGYYLMTGAAWARREIENEVQLFLGSQTIDARFTTSVAGAPRAAGRMLMLGCWLYQCTGDKALLARMHQRMGKAYLRDWVGREFTDDKVRIFGVRKPEAGALGGKVRFWKPWGESLAVLGFEAMHRMTDDAIAGRMAEAISTSVLRHGWLIDRSGPKVGYQIRWREGGLPLTRKQMLDRAPTDCNYAGDGLATWSIGALSIALEYARERGAQGDIDKAERLLRLLRKDRGRPNGERWWDRYREWDAIRR